MLFKQRAQSIDQPAYYSEISYGSKKSKKFADTITLEYPVKEIMFSNPQLKPFKISFEMSTSGYCDFDVNGKCFLWLYAQESYNYKNGIDTLR